MMFDEIKCESLKIRSMSGEGVELEIWDSALPGGKVYVLRIPWAGLEMEVDTEINTHKIRIRRQG